MGDAGRIRRAFVGAQNALSRGADWPVERAAVAIPAPRASGVALLRPLAHRALMAADSRDGRAW
jgi:hypothetical protein